MRHFVTLSIIALTVAAAPAANAQTFYTSLTAYNAAATTTQIYAFEGIASPGGTASNPGVLTQAAPGRVTFSITGGNDTSVYAYDSNFNGGIYRLSDGSDAISAAFPSTNATTTTIALGGSYTAFAIDYGMVNDAANSFTFALFSDNTQVGTTNNAPLLGGDRFFGATSATPFNNVRVTAAVSPGNDVGFDNARVGSAVVVPESGTVALLLPALGAVFCVAKSRLGAVVVARRRK